jgi:2-polyprenyl-6-methoxyphenol hydroxylase-like FAD-dependent oxidoreductase
MQSERPIIVAGAGPVGVITTLALTQQGCSVELFKAEERVNDAPRAATTHSATLPMLEQLGLIDDVVRQGLSNRNSAFGSAPAANSLRNSTSVSSKTTPAIRMSSSASSTSSPTSCLSACGRFRT